MKAAMQPIALMLGIFVTGPAFSSENANHTVEHVDLYGSWNVYRLVDRFDDREVGRIAATKIGEHGDVRYICSQKVYDFLYFELRADDQFDKSIGRDLGLERIDVKIRVDDQEIFQTWGAAPHYFALGSDRKRLADLFKAGSEARIRSEQRERRLTFKVDLTGFTRAAARVEKACPNPLGGF